MRSFVHFAAAIVLVGFATSRAAAQVIDTRIGPFRAAVTIPSFGQTFTAPAGATSLDRFTFFLASNVNDESTIPFRAFLYQWNGTRAQGAELYGSAVRQAAPCCTFPAETFETGGVAVIPGAQYVAFILPQSGSISMTFPTVANTYTDSYAGGRFTFTECAADPTSCDWYFSQQNPGLDAEFRAEFSGATVVPEPASLALLAVGMLLVGGFRRARREW